MKKVSVLGPHSAVLVLTMLAAACAVSGCDSGATQSRPPPGYAPGYGPYPPGYGPPPGYGQPIPQGQAGYRPAPGGLGGQPGYGPQPGGPQPGYAPTHVAPAAASFPEAINVASIQALANRNPKACGFVEVAAGVWTRVDCHAYAPAQKALVHLSPRKAMAISNHTTQWKPLRIFGGTFQQAMAQGFSKGIFQRPAGGTQSGVTGASTAPVIVADALPGTVDHRLQNLEGPIKDQGPVGACTAFSLSTTIDNAAIRAGKMQPGVAGQASSANHVWAGYGFPQMGTAADATLGRAIAPMSLWGQSHSESCKIANPIIGDCGTAVSPPVVAGTFRSDPNLVAKSDRADSGGLYKVVGFDKLVDDRIPVNIEQIMQTLATGADLWVAFRIDGFAWSSSKMRNGVIPDWNEPNGGHAVTMSGFRETPQGRQFLLHNNWGTSWGDKGYGWVSEAMVQKWMHFAYKVKLADGVKSGDLTDDDCAADEMVDVSKGVCGPICPDNTRPSNGCGGGAAPPAVPGAPAVPGIPGFQIPPGFPQIPGLPNFGR